MDMSLSKLWEVVDRKAWHAAVLGVTKNWTWLSREGNGTPLQYSCLENPMDGGAWWAAVHGVTKSQTWLSEFPFTFHFHALEKEMATHSSVLPWRIPGTGEPGGLPSMGSHRVGHDWSDLAAAAERQNNNKRQNSELGSASSQVAESRLKPVSSHLDSGRCYSHFQESSIRRERNGSKGHARRQKERLKNGRRTKELVYVYIHTLAKQEERESQGLCQEQLAPVFAS